MAKQKNKTPTQEKKSYDGLSKLCFFGEFVSVLSPYFAIGIANYDKYFMQYNGTKISIGFALAMIVMGVATGLVSKKNFQNSFVTILVGWALVTGILFLIKEILTDLCYIMLFGWAGIAGAYGLDIGKQKFKEKADFTQDGINQARKKQIADAYEKEIEAKQQKKVKVVLKK